MPAALVLILKNIFLSALGERVVAKGLFGAAKWLADLSDTSIDNDIVEEWEDAYYNKG